MQTIVPAMQNGKMVFCIVIHDSSMDRMKQSDPSVVEGATLLRALRGANLLLSDVDILLCYEPDVETFQQRCRELGNPHAVLKWLGRGWQNNPGDVGDPVVVPMGSEWGKTVDETEQVDDKG